MLKRNLIISFFAFVLVIVFYYFYQVNKHLPTPVPSIKAAIIPHHLVAIDFIDDLGKKLINNGHITQIIIIGPNHEELGSKPFITNDKSFSNDFIEYNPKIVINDHACSAPESVLKKNHPNTNFSCILISARTPLEEIDRLVKLLLTRLTETEVLIASVDFSHYKILSQANENDIITQKYLENFDINSLLTLDNGFLDSPKTIAVLFKYLSTKNITKFSLVNHSNSAIILNLLDTPSTTSYFEYVYY